MAEFGSNIDEDLQVLDAKVKQLRLDYEQYFLGSRPRVPNVLRGEVQKMIAYYANVPIQNTALRFRFNNLRARYFSFRRHWDETVRKIEDGSYERNVFKANLHERERAERRGGAGAARPRRRRRTRRPAGRALRRLPAPPASAAAPPAASRPTSSSASSDPGGGDPREDRLPVGALPRRRRRREGEAQGDARPLTPPAAGSALEALRDGDPRDRLRVLVLVLLPGLAALGGRAELLELAERPLPRLLGGLAVDLVRELAAPDHHRDDVVHHLRVAPGDGGEALPIALA